MDIAVQFGRNLRAYRIQRQLSQEDLGEIAGLHRTYISGLERGIRNPQHQNRRAAGRCVGSRTRRFAEKRAYKMSIFSTPGQLDEMRQMLVNYVRLPFSSDSIPGALTESALAHVRGGEVLRTYDFVDSNQR